MRENLSASVPDAIRSDVKSDAEESLNVKSDVQDRGWFVEMVQDLLPTKPGTQLHYLTGYDERLCQKYAAGSVKPSAYFLRVLLRSDQGGPFLSALMHGSEAQWWRELQRHKRMGEAADGAG